jgi:hypothetical protein
MLLHSNNRHVSATHVAIFRLVRTREYKYSYNCTVFTAERALIFHPNPFPVLKFHPLYTCIVIRESKHIPDGNL